MGHRTTSTGSMENASRNTSNPTYVNGRIVETNTGDNNSTRNTGVPPGLLGGLINGFFQNRYAKRLAETERLKQELAYKRSASYSSKSDVGTVDFNQETQSYETKLSPELRQLMETYLGISENASQQLLSMQDDPDKATRDAYGLFQDINADDYNQLRLQGEEQAYATGTGGGTQGFYDKLALEKSINANNRIGLYDAEGRGNARRQMVGTEALNFGNAGQNVAMSLENQVNSGISAGNSGNLNALGSPFADRNYTDTRSNMMTQFTKNAFGQNEVLNEDGKVTQRKKSGYFFLNEPTA